MAGTMRWVSFRSTGSNSVSMESGLDGRNNADREGVWCALPFCLNGVRPRWPEQCRAEQPLAQVARVSMESGLDGRNNPSGPGLWRTFLVTSQWSPA